MRRGAYAIVVVALLFAFAPWSATGIAQAGEGELPQLAEFSLQSLKGEHVAAKDFAGKVLLINFWATWCGPCLQELPHFDKLYKELADDGLVVLAISTDGPETASNVRRTVKRRKWKMPILLDQEGVVSGLLNPRGTNPFTMVVDRCGRVVYTHEGYNSGDEDVVAKIVRDALSQPCAAK